MKILVKILIPIVAVSSVTLATTAPSTTTKPTVPSTFALNPESIRVQVLENNTNLYQSVLSVEDAKNTVDNARASLFPSLTIGGSNLGSMIFGGPGFILSQFQFLLPFLMPSNYFALDQAKDNFNADLVGYKILEMNTYSSALALYYTVLADQKVQKVYQDEADNLWQIFDYLSHEQDNFGDVPPEQLSQAEGNYKTAEYNAQQLASKVADEVASLRQALGLKLGTVITLDDTSMPVSDWETKATQDVVNQALKLAPEAQQINYLIAAAEQGTYEKEFSWMNGFSLGGKQGQNGSGVSTSTYTVTGSFTLGLNLFPTIEISERNEDEVRTQLVQLNQSETSLIESTLANVLYGGKQLDLATSAESLMESAYMTIERNYEDGSASLLDALTAHSQLTQASIDRIETEMSLNMQRVTLHRAMLDDQFGKIQGCKAVQDKGSGGFLGLFGHKPKEESINQICKENGTNQ